MLNWWKDCDLPSLDLKRKWGFHLRNWRRVANVRCTAGDGLLGVSILSVRSSESCVNHLRNGVLHVHFHRCLGFWRIAVLNTTFCIATILRFHSTTLWCNRFEILVAFWDSTWLHLKVWLRVYDLNSSCMCSIYYVNFTEIRVMLKFSVKARKGKSVIFWQTHVIVLTFR